MAVNVEDAGFEIRDQIMWVYGSGFPKNHNLGEGRGTALKPAHEPLVLARKPISEKTVKANVEKWSTGGLNIEASRIPLNGEQRTTPIHSDDAKDDKTLFGLHPTIQHHRESTELGRFPANFIHDGDQQVLDLFPEVNSGASARFFYCAKANKKERSATVENKHPTVKPLKLMTYLIKLVTPPGGITLDPFMGSGSTGVAAVQSGYEFIGIEREEDYYAIAEQRVLAS